jgi:hypothetical protein
MFLTCAYNEESKYEQRAQYHSNCKYNHKWDHDYLINFYFIKLVQVHNLSFLTIHTNYTKFHMNQL